MQTSNGVNPEEEKEERITGVSDTDLDALNEQMELFARLLAALGELPPAMPPGFYDNLEPSAQAKVIAAQVKAQLLKDVGLATLGEYIARARQAHGLEQATFARQLELARDAIVQLETGRLPFWRLPPTKAVDLVEALKLDPPMVLAYLQTPQSSELRVSDTGSLFRLNRGAAPGQQRTSRTHSQAQSRSPDGDEQMAEFLTAFKQELARRGLLKK